MKKCIISIILLFIIIFTYSVDIDFGVFNYKGSRLKKIVRYTEDNKWPTAEMVYEYDDKGYLKKKYLWAYKRRKPSYTIYRSELYYEFDKNKIRELFFK